MKIVVLEHPRLASPRRFNDIANTPLWSCLMAGYVAANLLKADHEVTLLDAASSEWDFERAARELKAHSPDLLCVNAVYFWERTPSLFEFLARVKERTNIGHINLFGFYPSLAYDVILGDYRQVDSIAVGECEATVADLAARLKKNQDWTAVPGLAFRDGERVCYPQPRPPAPDPDVFPFPLRNPRSEETAGILTSRGCYNHCRFCPIPVFYGNGPLWRGRSVEKVMREIESILDSGTRDLYFMDPNFIGPGERGKRRIIDLAERLKPLKVTFGMETRPNDLDERVLKALTDAGLQSLLLGVESGSKDVLARLDKGGGLMVSQRAIALCRDAGVEPEIGFLMFVPDSSLEDIRSNFSFLMETNLLDRLERTANLLSHNQIVFRGATGFERFREQGRLVSSCPVKFEYEVSFLDERVKWLSDIVTPACLRALKEMSREDSPMYWESCKSNDTADHVNDFLVTTFDRLLILAESPSRPPAAEAFNRIERELLAKLREPAADRSPLHSSGRRGCNR